MGQRQLRVAPELLVEFLKDHSSLHRTYTVGDPIPDDAKIVDVVYKADNIFALILESSEWAGLSEIPLKPPTVTVYFGSPEELANG